MLCDEFCSSLHRRLARAISFNLRKLATRRNLAVVVACSTEDLRTDLNPDTLVRLDAAGRCSVEMRPIKPNPAFSLRRRLIITRGTKRDYAHFASMHYRATTELGFVDKIFVMRDRTAGDPLGIVVYSHSPLELALRNQATGGRFVRKPRELNRRFRMLRRLVIHPDLRGCGLGHHLVRATMPLVGTEYIECLANMGDYNPVFERAGMKRIGCYDVAPKRRAALEELRTIDLDPNDPRFPQHVARRPRVREIISNVVYDWYAGTTGGGTRRVERQSPELLAQTFRGLVASRPVYYLWKRKPKRTRRPREA